MTDTDRTLHGDDEIDLNDDDDLDDMVQQAESVNLAENNGPDRNNDSTIVSEEEERDIQTKPYHHSQVNAADTTGSSENASVSAIRNINMYWRGHGGHCIDFGSASSCMTNICTCFLQARISTQSSVDNGGSTNNTVVVSVN